MYESRNSGESESIVCATSLSGLLTVPPASRSRTGNLAWSPDGGGVQASDSARLPFDLRPAPDW